MLRLLALVPLLAAPLGLTLTSPDPHAGPAHVTHAPARHELVLDASAMPGESGWFLVPVTAARASRAARA